jgi:xanthine dehydrogenase small subunit
VLRRGAATRTLPLEGYFLGYGKQDRQLGEFVEAVIVPKIPAGRLFRIYKLSKRFDQDISAVCAGISIGVDDGQITDARIAFGGMAATPKRASACEAVLTGQPWTEATVRAGMAALADDFQPIDDMRASAGYRLQAAQNLLLRSFLESTGAAPLRLLNVQAVVHA